MLRGPTGNPLGLYRRGISKSFEYPKVISAQLWVPKEYSVAPAMYCTLVPRAGRLLILGDLYCMEASKMRISDIIHVSRLPADLLPVCRQPANNGHLRDPATCAGPVAHPYTSRATSQSQELHATMYSVDCVASLGLAFSLSFGLCFCLSLPPPLLVFIWPLLAPAPRLSPRHDVHRPYVPQGYLGRYHSRALLGKQNYLFHTALALAGPLVALWLAGSCRVHM